MLKKKVDMTAGRHGVSDSIFTYRGYLFLPIAKKDKKKNIHSCSYSGTAPLGTLSTYAKTARVCPLKAENRKTHLLI